MKKPKKVTRGPRKVSGEKDMGGGSRFAKHKETNHNKFSVFRGGEKGGIGFVEPVEVTGAVFQHGIKNSNNDKIRWVKKRPRREIKNPGKSRIENQPWTYSKFKELVSGVMGKGHVQEEKGLKGDHQSHEKGHELGLGKDKQVDFMNNNEKLREHEIYTSMHVEMVAPNHLRLLDEPEPPDRFFTSGSKNDGNEVLDMEEESDEEIEVDVVEETPMMQQS